MTMLTTIALLCVAHVPCEQIEVELNARKDTHVVYVQKVPNARASGSLSGFRDIITGVEREKRLSFSVVVIAIPAPTKRGYVFEHMSCLLDV